MCYIKRFETVFMAYFMFEVGRGWAASVGPALVWIPNILYYRPLVDSTVASQNEICVHTDKSTNIHSIFI